MGPGCNAGVCLAQSNTISSSVNRQDWPANNNNWVLFVGHGPCPLWNGLSRCGLMRHPAMSWRTPNHCNSNIKLIAVMVITTITTITTIKRIMTHSSICAGCVWITSGHCTCQILKRLFSGIGEMAERNRQKRLCIWWNALQRLYWQCYKQICQLMYLDKNE